MDSLRSLESDQGHLRLREEFMHILGEEQNAGVPHVLFVGNFQAPQEVGRRRLADIDARFFDEGRTLGLDNSPKPKPLAVRSSKGTGSCSRNMIRIPSWPIFWVVPLSLLK